MDEVATMLADLGRVLGQALRLDPAVVDSLADTSSLGIVLGVLVLATVSIGAGHLGVLFLNRVPPARLAGAFGVGLVALAALRAGQAVLLWAVASPFADTARPLSTVMLLAVLALAPQVYAVCTALPHVGLFFGKVLQVWELLVLFVGVQVLYDVPRWQAALIVGVTFGTVQLLTRLLAEPLRRLGARVWTVVSGRPTLLTARDLLSGTPLVPVHHDLQDAPSGEGAS